MTKPAARFNVPPMYTIETGIDIHFAHHIRGHDGACIHLHGHTWRFEVGLAARELDAQGFVVDFDRLDAEVLRVCHALLDHSLAMGEATYRDIAGELENIGVKLVASRAEIHGRTDTRNETTTTVFGAENRYPGGLRVAVFPFNPTSERLAEWLWGLAAERLEDGRVLVEHARIYETLHPLPSSATYRPERRAAR